MRIQNVIYDFYAQVSEKHCASHVSSAGVYYVCENEILQPVSYTHLDVYKRQ